MPLSYMNKTIDHFHLSPADLTLRILPSCIGFSDLLPSYHQGHAFGTLVLGLHFSDSKLSLFLFIFPSSGFLTKCVREIDFLRPFVSENSFIPPSLMINCQCREF